jgi:hypothetical protein
MEMASTTYLFKKMLDDFKRPTAILHVWVFLGCISVAQSVAGTLHVPSEYPTIQSAVDSAADGDSILVATGNYSEQFIQIRGKRLYIVGAGRDATFISSAPAVGFLIDQQSEISIVGFDFTSGGGPGGASSFQVGDASLTLTSCRIHDSNGGGAGGGAIEASLDASIICSDVLFLRNSGIAGAIFISGGNAAHFTRCLFEDNFTNRSFNSAGAVHVMAQDARFVDCDFIGNTSIAGNGGLVGGVYFAGELGGTCLIERCLFLRNEGTSCGGILIEYGGSATLRNCTIAGNTAQVISAVGVGISGPPGMTLLEDSLITANGPSPALDCVSGMLTVTCCDVWGNADDTICPGGTNNIAADPQFCGTDRWDLQADSPCSPANNPTCGLVGARDVGCGANAVEQSTWGRVKATWHKR